MFMSLPRAVQSRDAWEDTLKLSFVKLHAVKRQSNHPDLGDKVNLFTFYRFDLIFFIGFQPLQLFFVNIEIIIFVF